MLAINRTQAISGVHPPINPSIGEIVGKERNDVHNQREEQRTNNINP
jgi:hypothetical protein